jgi:hypothetical protein
LAGPRNVMYLSGRILRHIIWIAIWANLFCFLFVFFVLCFFPHTAWSGIGTDGRTGTGAAGWQSVPVASASGARPQASPRLALAPFREPEIPGKWTGRVRAVGPSFSMVRTKHAGRSGRHAAEMAASLHFRAYTTVRVVRDLEVCTHARTWVEG